MVVMCHWIATAWCLLGKMEMKWGITNSWIQVEKMEYSEWYVRYIRSFYWSLTTALLVGPTTNNYIEWVFTAMVLFYTLGIFAYLLSSISLIIQEIHQKNEEYRCDMELINGFMRMNRIAKQTQAKIRSHLEYVYLDREKNKRNESVIKVLEKLPKIIKEELTQEINLNLFNKQTFLTNNFSENTVEKLSKISKEQTYVTNDIIIDPNDKETRSLFIINHGTVEICLKSEQSEQLFPIKILGPREMFGDLGFLTGQDYKYTVRSNSFVSLLVLERKKFIKILRKNQDEYERYKLMEDQLFQKGTTKYFMRKCLICQSQNHNENDCHLLCFRAKKLNLLYKKQLDETYVQGRKRYLRSRCKTNSYIIYEDLENITYVLSNQQGFQDFFQEQENLFQQLPGEQQYSDEEQYEYYNNDEDEDYDDEYQSEDDEQGDYDEENMQNQQLGKRLSGPLKNFKRIKEEDEFQEISSNDVLSRYDEDKNSIITIKTDSVHTYNNNNINNSRELGTPLKSSGFNNMPSSMAEPQQKIKSIMSNRIISAQTISHSQRDIKPHQVSRQNSQETRNSRNNSLTSIKMFGRSSSRGSQLQVDPNSPSPNNNNAGPSNIHSHNQRGKPLKSGMKSQHRKSINNNNNNNNLYCPNSPATTKKKQTVLWTARPSSRLLQTKIYSQQQNPNSCISSSLFSERDQLLQLISQQKKMLQDIQNGQLFQQQNQIQSQIQQAQNNQTPIQIQSPFYSSMNSQRNSCSGRTYTKHLTFSQNLAKNLFGNPEKEFGTDFRIYFPWMNMQIVLQKLQNKQNATRNSIIRDKKITTAPFKKNKIRKSHHKNQNNIIDNQGKGRISQAGYI